MDPKTSFNIAICLMGVVLLSLHAFNLLTKKNKRKDEKAEVNPKLDTSNKKAKRQESIEVPVF